MDMNKLLPGYTHQGFSLARSELWKGIECVKDRNKYAAMAVRVPVTLINKATEYVEVPVRVVEDIALSVINAALAIKNKECRSNLKHCFSCIRADVLDVAIVGCVVAFKFVAIAVIIINISIAVLNCAEKPASRSDKGLIHILNVVLNCEANPTRRSDKELINYYRIQAMRKHGYENLIKLETLQAVSPYKYLIYKSIYPTDVAEFYQEVAKVKKEDFDQFYTKTEKKGNCEPKQWQYPTEWECPKKLEGDDSDSTNQVKRILKNSQGIYVSKMLRKQSKPYLCSLLGIDSNSAPADIKKKYFEQLRLVHADKNPNNENEKYYSWATQAITAAWGLYTGKS